MTRRLRYAYFAAAADSAGRYGIEFDEVLRHLWTVRSLRRFTLRSVRHMDDLVHAVACKLSVNLAWMDLIERAEPVLARRCAEHLGNEMQALLLVRRLFAGLRRPDCEDSLWRYAGEQPLRAWMAERLLRQVHGQPRVWCFSTRRRQVDARVCYAGGSATAQLNAAMGTATIPFPPPAPAMSDDDLATPPRPPLEARATE